MIGTLQAAEALKLLIGCGTSLAGRLLLFWFVLAFSVALSHAPGRIRHRQLF